MAMPAHLIESRQRTRTVARVSAVEVSGVEALLASIDDRARTRPILVVSVAADTGEPRVDLSHLCRTVGKHADVAVLASSRVSAKMSSLVDASRRVYGGGCRLFWPGGRSELFLTFTARDSPRTVNRIATALRQGIES